MRSPVKNNPPAPPPTLSVRLTPRGGRDAVIGVSAEGVLHLRVAAPPVDGAANAACLILVAKILGLRPSQILLTAGETHRDKRFSVSGLTAEELAVRLAALPPLGGAGENGRENDDAQS